MKKMFLMFLVVGITTGKNFGQTVDWNPPHDPKGNFMLAGAGGGEGRWGGKFNIFLPLSPVFFSINSMERSPIGFETGFQWPFQITTKEEYYIHPILSGWINYHSKWSLNTSTLGKKSFFGDQYYVSGIKAGGMITKGWFVIGATGNFGFRFPLKGANSDNYYAYREIEVFVGFRFLDFHYVRPCK